MRLVRDKQLNPATRPGAATVELALVVPLLVALVMGSVEASRALQVTQVLADATRSAGRFAIQPLKTVADVDAIARAIISHNKLDASKATVTVKVNGTTTTHLASAKVGDDVSVTVSLPLTSATFVAPLFFTADRWLSETIVMIRQQ